MVFKYGKCSSCGRNKQMVAKPRKCVCGSELELSDNWYVRWTHQGRTQVKAVSTRKQDAMNFEAEVRRSVRLNVLLPGEEVMITWEQAVESFKEWLALGNVKESTAGMYKACLKPLEVFSGRNLQDIAASEVITYQATRRKTVKPATCNRELATLKRMYSLHCDWNSAQKAPRLHLAQQDIVRVALLPENNVSSTFWTLDESRKLLEACSSERLRMIVYTGLLSGLRLSNILNLRWDQVGKDTITIASDEMKAGEVLTIPLHPSLSVALKKYRLESGNGFSRYVFKTGEGSIMSWFYKYFHEARKAAGLPEAKFHTSRHSFASHFVMNGGDIATLSELLGHADISITKKRYAHLSQEHKIEQVTKFAMEV
jgi:integrase